MHNQPVLIPSLSQIDVYSINSPLPSLPDVVVISSQPGKARTVLMNLLCKAVSFSFGRLEQMPYSTGCILRNVKMVRGMEVGV